MERSPKEAGAGADYFFMTSAVAPRPIAWVTTKDPETGVVNVAPFSWYQAVCADPPMLMLALGDRPGGGDKDTLRNARASRELVVNVATEDNVQALVASSGEFGPEESEADALGLELTPSHAVAPPRLAASPVHLECRLVDTHRYGDGKATTLLIAEVVHFAADDDVLDERGNVDPAKLTFLARLGGKDYAAVHEVFQVERPRDLDALRR